MKSNRQWRAILAVATIAAAALLAGCSSGSSDALSYWAAFTGTPTQKHFQKTFVDSYNAKTHGAKVTMSVKQLTTLAKLTSTAVSAGRGPDVVYSPGPSSALGFSASKRIDDLSSYASKYGWQDKLQPWAYQASLVDGKLYSIPVSYGSVVMFYNPAVFKEHGWQVPTTAAEFDKVATAASKAGMIPVGAGNSGYTAESEWYLTAVLNASVGPQELHDVLTGSAKFTDPAFVDAITTFRDQIDKGWWGGGAKRWFTNTDTDMFTGLAAGKVAMYMTGTWSFGSADSYFGKAAGNDAKWDWAPLPALSDNAKPGVFPLAIGTSLSVNSESKKKADAAAFINSMVSDPAKSYAYLAQTGENPPPLVDTASMSSSVDERVARLYNDIPKSDNLGYATWTFLPAATDTYLYTEFDKVITGDVSPADYLAGLQKTFDQEKAAGKVITPFTPAGG